MSICYEPCVPDSRLLAIAHVLSSDHGLPLCEVVHLCINLCNELCLHFFGFAMSLHIFFLPSFTTHTQLVLYLS